MNKKGVVFTRPRDTISFFVGLFVAAMGGIPLLHKWGMIGWNLPFLNFPMEIFIWLVAIFGAYVVIDGFIEPPMHKLHWILILIGLVFLVLGLIPLLNSFGIIGWSLPGIGSNLMLYRVILTLEGIALLIGGLTEH